MKHDNQPVLIVDDNELNREVLSRRLLQYGYEVYVAEDGGKALKMLETHRYGLVLLDITMPGIDGYQVLEHMKSTDVLRHVPVIMITGVDDLSSTAKCIELGAEDYLPKPFNPVLLKARVSACFDKKRLHDQEHHYQEMLQTHNGKLQEQVREQVKDLSSAQLATIFAMSKLAESKDPETGAHLDRMREYCKLLSQQLSSSARHASIVDKRFVDSIYAASPLHDIGKVGVPDHILLKPGKLDPDEWTIMKTHCAIGAETLRAVHALHPGNEFIAMGIDISQSHHEKWDGTGYPFGLSGEQIPLSARILALGDVYDALTSRRCYKEPFSHEKSLNIILEGKGGHFDPDVVDAFLETENEFVRIRKHHQDPDQ